MMVDELDKKKWQISKRKKYKGSKMQSVSRIVKKTLETNSGSRTSY